MQQVIYADVLVFLNTVVTFILLLTVKLFAGAESGAGRLAAAAFAGGIYSLVILAPEMDFFLTLLTKTVMCVSIVLIAFRLRSVRKTARCAFLFLGVSFLYAGALYALSCVLEPNVLQVRNGFGYWNLGVGALIVLCAALYVLIRRIKKRFFSFRPADMIYELEVEYGDRRVQTKALLDSGNAVRDIYYHRPVIILSAAAAEALAGPLPSAEGLLSATADFPSPFRLLPVSTVGAGTLLPAFTAEKAVIKRENEYYTIKSPCVAVTGDPLGGEKYGALINEAAVNGEG